MTPDWPERAFLVVAVTPDGQLRRKVFLSESWAGSCEKHWHSRGWNVFRSTAALVLPGGGK